MYKKELNEITFPHLIAGNILGGREHTWNCVNAGAFKIEDFGYTTNTFFGGRCGRLGLISEYGFYACKSKTNDSVIGFYIDDPNKVTELGRRLIIDQYPNINVKFMFYTDRPITQEDMKKREELRAELESQYGVDAKQLVKLSSEELEGLLKATKSGKSNKALAEIVSIDPTPPDAEPKVTINTHKTATASAKRHNMRI